jgi:DNA-binding IclR family transcriptional regulator
VSVSDTVGVSGLARILSSLSDGNARSVADLAREQALPRSTAFDLVKRLQEAQLVAREPTGKLVAGPRFIALAFSRFGLERLHGPAEAILTWLRDHCDATARLTCAGPRERVMLAASSAAWAKSAAMDRPATMSYALYDAGGAEVARLDLICRHISSRTERSEIETLALRAKASLEYHLRDEAAN